jgi:hypothetical protein
MALAASETAAVKGEGFGYAGMVGYSLDLNWDGTTDLDEPNRAYTGEFRFRFDGASPYSSPQASSILTDPFYAFCVDLPQPVPDAWVTYEIVGLEQVPLNGDRLVSQAKANDLRELFGKHSGDINSNYAGEAFGLCVWEIVYERPGVAYDVYSGAMTARGLDGNAPTLAASWLGDIIGDVSAYDWNIIALASSTHQDFALASPVKGGPGAGAIPEPLTFFSAAMGVCGVGAYLRKRRKA